MQIGFELWTMQEDILFDNIYIGHSIEDAAALRKETYETKKTGEEKAEKADKPAPSKEEKTSPLDLNFMDDPVLFVKEKVTLFIELAKKNPVDAVKFVPEVAGAIGVGLLTLLIVLVGAGSSAAPSKEEVKKQAQQTKASAQKTKDQVAEAVATGADNVKEEVNKRTTRSSAQ